MSIAERAAHSQCVNGIKSCKVRSRVCTPGANLQAWLALPAAAEGWAGRLVLEEGAKLPE